MCNKAITHDPTACTLCEVISPEVFRRHWKHEPKAGHWHTIADGPDLIGRLLRQAHYLTVLAYRPGPDGSPAHYCGPLYWEFDAEDPAQALADLRRGGELLHTAYDCPGEALHIWHSGGRGFHVTIPPLVLGAEAGHPQLPHIYAAMIQVLFPPIVAPTLDRSIFSGGRGRMWRLPNRRRSDTGRYKVPLSMREVLHKPYTHLEAFTLRPRKGSFWPPEAELTRCLGLAELYQETVTAVEGTVPRDRRRGRGQESLRGHEGLLFHAFEARGWLGQEIEPGKWAVICPWESRHTKGECLDTSTILFAPGEGGAVGWLHCSHMHCASRDLSDVLALFNPAELEQARRAACIPDRDAPVHGGTHRTFSETSGRWPSHMTVEVL
jgi:hypothetical protein